MEHVDENFTEASWGCYNSSDPISRPRFIMNLHVLQDSMKRPGVKVETWQGSWCFSWWKFHFSFMRMLQFIWTHLKVIHDSLKRHGVKVDSLQGSQCWILMKISQKLHKDTPIYMTPYPSPSGTFLSWRLQEETFRKGGVLTGFLMLDLNKNFTEAS